MKEYLTHGDLEKAQISKNDICIYSNLLSVLKEDYIYTSTYLPDYFDELTANINQFKKNVIFIKQMLKSTKIKNWLSTTESYITINDFWEIKFDRDENSYVFLDSKALTPKSFDKNLKFAITIITDEANHRFFKKITNTDAKFDNNTFEDVYEFIKLIEK